MKYLIILLVFTVGKTVYGGYKHIGNFYSRTNIKDSFHKHNDIIQKLALNTVLINSKVRTGINRGTGFYLGLHKGKHLVLTNSHVMDKNECEGARVTFLTRSLNTFTFSCNEILLNLYQREQSDLTLFSVKFNGHEDKLGSGLKLDLSYSPIAGEELAIIGFGIKKAPSRMIDFRLKRFTPLLSMDNDCVIASPTGVTVFFGGSSQVDHTFATGCDVATGDSGSAILNRNTGEVVGLLWGMGSDATDKYKQQNSEYFMNEVVGKNHSMVWKNLSYGILLSQLQEKLSTFLTE